MLELEYIHVYKRDSWCFYPMQQCLQKTESWRVDANFVVTGGTAIAITTRGATNDNKVGIV